MTATNWLQLVAVGAALVVVVPPLGRYLAAVYSGGSAPGDRIFSPIERVVYRLIGGRPDHGQRWSGYALSFVGFSLASVLFLFLILRLQGVLPLNSTDLPGVPPALAFNTAVSFVTGTNWQAYAGENTMSTLSQMAGLTVAQFTAAAVGLSVAVALIRGLVHLHAEEPGEATLGNFWTDLTRTVVRVLLPIAVVAALVLVSQGVVQNLREPTVAATIEGAVQVIPGGPAASQEVMKTLGTNGGGHYNTNSAHPFENANGFTNAFQLLLVLAIPFALPLAYGRMAGRRRQGLTIVAVMAVLWLAPVVVSSFVEGAGNPLVEASGGNLEGKEVRLGAAGSSLLAVGTMGTSAGVASSALDSYTPVGGLSALGPILLGEISPGGVGAGLYAMLVYVLLAVFIGGLMVGRTPEYLGKKIGSPEIKLVTLYVLTLPAVVLVGTAATVVLPTAVASALNPGAHGFTEMLYAFASAANGNGSAFAGLDANTDWYNTALGLAMLAGRFLLIVPVLALAGSMAGRRIHAPSLGTLPTSGPTFASILTAVVLVVGGLTYLPALVLGPLLEQVSL